MKKGASHLTPFLDYSSTFSKIQNSTSDFFFAIPSGVFSQFSPTSLDLVFLGIVLDKY